MAGITVAAFFADVPGSSRFEEYRDYAAMARRSLELTNPGAQYVVISDQATGAKFADSGFEVAFCANPKLPLMRQIIDAQGRFVARIWDGVGLLVMPDIDAMPNRKLADATEKHHGLVITHKGLKNDYRINNLAYIRDAALGSWFLARAAEILESWPREQWDWWGDQDAWGAALGRRINGVGAWVLVKEYAGDKLLAEPERGKQIWVYPCSTHNCPMSNHGEITNTLRDAYFVHFKGPRKDSIATWFKKRFGHEFA